MFLTLLQSRGASPAPPVSVPVFNVVGSGRYRSHYGETKKRPEIIIATQHDDEILEIIQLMMTIEDQWDH